MKEKPKPDVASQMSTSGGGKMQGAPPICLAPKFIIPGATYDHVGVNGYTVYCIWVCV